MSAASVHLILSDIPYGIGVDDWDVLHPNTNSAFLGSSPAQQKAGAVFQKRGKPLNGWSAADREIPAQYYEWCKTWTSQWLRVLKPGGSAIVFAGRRLAHRCIAAMEDAGFTFKDMLAWLRELHRTALSESAWYLNVEAMRPRHGDGKVGVSETFDQYSSQSCGLRNLTRLVGPLQTTFSNTRSARFMKRHS